MNTSPGNDSWTLV